MKKRLLYFVILLSSTFTIAQPSGMLEEVWFLDYIEIEEDEYIFAPLGTDFTLNFVNDNSVFSIQIVGEENVMTGEINFSGESFSHDGLLATMLDCEQQNCDFEDLYFYSFLTTVNFDPNNFIYSYQQFNTGEKTLLLTDSRNHKAYFHSISVAPNPFLFQTWFLYETEGELGGGPNPVTSSNPPRITIHEDMTYTAIHECEVVTGNFISRPLAFFPREFILIPQNYLSNIDNCLPGNEPSFSSFQTMSPIHMDVSADRFTLEPFPGFIARYRNVLLSTTENALLKISIFPNPASATITIQNSSSPINSYAILDVSGRVIHQSKFESETIDVSALKAGMYFLEISSEGKKGIKKFVKK
ncbi:T9SS type A sorting domain-containing protein [Jejudonia soesokkakensis]|uniref:T9SS type A sorting domain-containing protein n=1 Tax=Jejudonia soesokkakensis TaxID=1323432 RepID=A0ABW2MQ73_9FLAO